MIERDLGEEALYFLADIRTAQDYSPFGVTLEGRSFVLSGAEKGRYGYQGSEKDDEVKGKGNSYTTEFRLLDPRLGRWLTLDPVADASSSPYSSMDNSPVILNDQSGLYTKKRAKEIKRTAKKLGGNAFISNASGLEEDWTVTITYKHCGQVFSGVFMMKNLTDLNSLTMEVSRPSYHVEDVNGETPSMTDYEMDMYSSQEETLGSFRKREAAIAAEEKRRQARYAMVDQLESIIAGIFIEGTYTLAGGEVIDGVFQGCRWLYNAYKATKPAKAGARLWPAASGGRTVVNGIEYTTHALERMQPVGTIMKGTTSYSRGVPPSVVENVIKYGSSSPGNTAGTVVRTFENVRVITNAQGTKVITVIKTGN